MNSINQNQLKTCRTNKYKRINSWVTSGQALKAAQIAIVIEADRRIMLELQSKT